MRNRRAAAGVAALTHGWPTSKIHALELEKDAAAPVLREAVRTGPPALPRCSFACTYISSEAVT